MIVRQSEPYLQWDIATLTNAYKEKTLSPVEVTEELLRQIESVDKQLNAYITVTAEEAIERAKQAEAEIYRGEIKGPLHGVPIALKDIIYTKNMKTTMGSEIFRDFVPKEDATVVTRLKEGGAIILGKLNTHPFAYGATGDRSYFGATKNPHHFDKIPGGSSNGSGAAVAASLCYGALGTDTGGSVRIPSSFCGIVGMKPTFGRVSKYGVFPLCETMDHVGPMTRTVRDNALMLNVIAGYDERDPYSFAQAEEDFTRFLDDGIKGMKIGVLTPHRYTNREVDQAVLKSVRLFRELGAEIVDIEIPNMDVILEAFRTVMKCEAYAVHKDRLNDYPERWWDPEVRERLLSGKDATAVEYIEANKIRSEARRQYEAIFKRVDILITPTLPILPTNVEERIIEVAGMQMNIRLLLNHFTGPLNFTGLPSLSLPCGTSEEGLPIGLQLVGKRCDEANVYRVAAAFERELKERGRGR